MTTTCNHACIFCSEDDRMKLYAKYPLTELQIKTILVDRAKKGFNYVNFTGWEPTLFPNFLRLLKFAKKLGYSIYVGTNGTMLAKPEFTQEFLEYVDVLSLSIHWFDQESCVRQVWDEGHYDRFRDIAKNVTMYKKSHHYFQSNIVINELNYRHLIDIAKNMMDMGYDVNHFLVSYIAPEGLARRDYKALSMDYADVMPHIHILRDFSQIYQKELRIFGIPLCVLGDDYEQISNDTHWKERNTIERFTTKEWNVALVDIYSSDNSRERVFVDKCMDCKWKESPCTGVFEAYLKYYSF